jgi:transposase
MKALSRQQYSGSVLNNVAYSKNCHNGSFEIMRCLSKKAPCGSMSCWFIYTPHHLYSIWYIKVTIRGTLPIFWDTTNVFTYIESGEELPQKGRSKQKRHDKNLVTFGIAQSNENIPLIHETYPGNVHDAKLFPEIIDKLVDRLRNLKINTTDMTVVFDKGNNSDDNINKALENMHVIGSLKRNQVKTLMEVTMSEYDFLYKSSKVNEVYGYRTKKHVFGQEFTVVVSYNSKSHAKKEKKYEENKIKILKGLAELKKKAEPENGKGKKITRKGLCTNANKIIYSNLSTIFKYKISEEGKITFEYWVDKTAEEEFKNSFGKIAIFTDLHDSSSADIARTYFGKNLVEEDFKFLKDKLLIPVPPLFMRKDGRIRVHVFLCVMGMLFYRYLAKKVKYMGLSIKELQHQLEGIRMAFVKKNETSKISLVVEEMNPIQAKLFSRLELNEFLI